MSRYALLVGADTFDDPGLRRLYAPSTDILELSEVLGAPDIGGFEVQAIVNQSHSKVIRQIHAFFSRRRRDDLLLLYFSGHGLEDHNGNLFFAMPDTELEYLESTAVAAQAVHSFMNATAARTKIVLLDCCNSGSFPRGMTAKAGGSMHTVQRLGGHGRVIITASDAMQYAFEGDDLTGRGVRSIFTRVMVEGLETGRADLDGDGEIDIDELYSYIHDRIVAENPAQVPRKWALGVKGKVVVARSRPQGDSLPIELVQALLSSFARIRRSAIEEVGRLLESGETRLYDAAVAALQQAALDTDSNVSAAAAKLLQARTNPVTGDTLPTRMDTLPIRMEANLLGLRYAARSDIGMLAERNEDSAYASGRLLAVADGGGHGGDTASAAAIAAIARLGGQGIGRGDLLGEIETAARDANDRLRLLARGSRLGMSTTLTALAWSGGTFALVHIGNSRAYLLRDQELYQITHDHTLVQELLDDGRITNERAASHPQRGVLLRALTGDSEIDVDLSLREARVGDRYLLSTSGLHGVVSAEILHHALTTIEDPDEVVGYLIDFAKRRGGGPENITCVVADVVVLSHPDFHERPPRVIGAAGLNAQLQRRRQAPW
ncbi:caspase, EACC1-associated type [Acrocarpospora catenulata]|uniref:caspase, EACC1-associated type n=1 Tax=Acrocarpospora catenulata TaxID=2836182 RepID=UPI001BD9A77B|nr:caspase family protein [Acrocarpospora catenulata]